MMINATEDDERDRVIDALAGMADAAANEPEAGVTEFREKRQPDFGTDDS